MKMTLSTLVAAVALSLAGCSTIEFDNSDTGYATTGSESYSYWHHNLAYSLYEFSEPVNLSNCSNEWSSLVVEKSLVTAIAGSIDSVLLVDVWDPWAVTLNC